MYTVHGSRRSRAMRVLWTLEELGQPHDHLPAAPRSEAVRALNPSGKIPVLTDGDAVLTDSVAIMTYLADRHGALTHPAGTHARASQDAITHMLIDEFDAILWAAAKHSFVLPEDQRRPEIKESLRAEFLRSEAALEAVLARSGGPWLMGGAFTLPDILAVHCLDWAAGARFGPRSEALRSYAERARARPAYGRAAARG